MAARGHPRHPPEPQGGRRRAARVADAPRHHIQPLHRVPDALQVPLRLCRPARVRHAHPLESLGGVGGRRCWHSRRNACHLRVVHVHPGEHHLRPRDGGAHAGRGPHRGLGGAAAAARHPGCGQHRVRCRVHEHARPQGQPSALRGAGCRCKAGDDGQGPQRRPGRQVRRADLGQGPQGQGQRAGAAAAKRRMDAPLGSVARQARAGSRSGGVGWGRRAHQAVRGRAAPCGVVARAAGSAREAGGQRSAVELCRLVGRQQQAFGPRS
mmetsp:Transcript_3278/g.13484  ORF Transcript_3278/g.13484 Transcript_3278/m.13484 type:complete len:267 (+) Transcript_3278:1049-1849(+)